MDILGDFSLEVTRWLQGNYPQLEPLFKAISQAGMFEFYLVIITLSYWCLHKQLGRAITYLAILSYTGNAIIKHLFRDQRPFWKDASVALVQERSYGIPSGHTQTATVVYGVLSMFARRSWVWLLAILLAILMAASRVYLGVHDIEDVVAGAILGALVLLAYALWKRYFVSRFNNRILGQRLLIALMAPVILAIVYAAGLILLDPPDRPPQLDALVDTAEAQSWDDSASAFGLLAGMSVGFVLEMSRVRFMVEGSFWRRALRYILGMAGGLLLWKGLDALFPAEPLIVAFPLRFLRYLLLALWVSYYAPLVFVRLKLADSRPEPEVSLTL
jgi:membrane-associated phospholipid phosphatase